MVLELALVDHSDPLWASFPKAATVADLPPGGTNPRISLDHATFSPGEKY